jgi:hypothetical protein
MRAAIATVVVCIAATAHADSSPRVAAAEPAKEPEPDPIADIESREANLESKEPRNGFTFAGALGFGVLIGGDIGVGRGPSLSLRLGHVATRRTIITFELTGSSGLHKEGTDDDTLADSNFALFAGAQTYTSRSFWLRGAAGITTFVEDADARSGSGGQDPVAGLGALVGAGLDVIRSRYFVLGIEIFALGSVSSDGAKLQIVPFSLGLSFY